LSYAPGDSLGVFARNPPALVEELISWLGFDPDTPVKDPQGDITSLRHALAHGYILNRANKKIISGLSERIPQGEQRNRLMEIADNDEVLGEYLYTRDYVDVLRDFDEARFESPRRSSRNFPRFRPGFIPSPPPCRPIPRRCICAWGSCAMNPTVARRPAWPRDFFPTCRRSGDRIPVYVQEARHFRLPADSTRNIIMCGPGTGIAPFRAFLEQRILDGAKGRHWLVFGEQHRATDFLYGEEFLRWQKEGQLHRLDLAFSARPGPQDLRATPPAGSRGRILVLVATRRLLLRSAAMPNAWPGMSIKPC
jgi:sulfite reductase (NADPH) flavoprotein alpha-component